MAYIEEFRFKTKIKTKQSKSPNLIDFPIILEYSNIFKAATNHPYPVTCSSIKLVFPKVQFFPSFWRGMWKYSLSCVPLIWGFL